jgi:hypothetical protein
MEAFENACVVNILPRPADRGAAHPERPAIPMKEPPPYQPTGRDHKSNKPNAQEPIDQTVLVSLKPLGEKDPRNEFACSREVKTPLLIEPNQPVTLQLCVRNFNLQSMGSTNNLP